MSVGLLYFELDLDTTKFVKKQEDLNAKIKSIASNTDLALQKSYDNLKVTADAVYKLQANLATASYERITKAANQSFADQTRAAQAYIAEINKINSQMANSQSFGGLGIRSAQMIATDKANMMRWYEQAKTEAAGSASELVRIEAAKDAKLIALDNELNAVQIANDAKALASAKATADAQRAIEERLALDHIQWAKMEREAYAANDAFNIASSQNRIALLRKEAAERAVLAQTAMQSKTADWSLMGAGRSTEAIKAEQVAVEAAYARQKVAAAGNVRDLTALEEGKNAKMLALNTELHASRIATMQREKAATAEKVASQIAMEKTATEARNANYATLGMKSAASINEQIANVQKAALAQQAIVGKGSEDWIRIERTKNEKLKELNKEMTGDHEMSMASMTRAVLRFYAAFYVAQMAVQTLGSLFMGGIKAIDEMKVSSIAVAAQITSMQGTTGNVTENYKTNLKYAQALIPVLMEIDALSLANLSEITKMNMAMANQGVILDINNKKQIQSFTALTNAVALFTQEQDRGRQASQEIRSLFSGQVRPGDMVSLQMDALIKKQGIYADGLKGFVEHWKKVGKTSGEILEKMEPYLVGIVAASGDLAMTWQAVSSSIGTAWNIIQRGIFKDVYKTLTEEGNKAAQSLKDNAEDIVKWLNNIKTAFGYATIAGVGFALAMGTFAAFAAFPAMMTALGAAVSFLVVQLYDGTLMATTWAALTSKSVAAVTFSFTGLFAIMSTGFAGYMVGSWLNQFEEVRKFGVAMVYGLIDAFAKLKLVVATTKIALNFSMSDEAKAKALENLSVVYAKDKELRDKQGREQFESVTDAAIAAAKLKEKVATPEAGKGEGTSEAYKLLGIKSKEEIEQQKKAVINAYEEIKKSNKSSTQDIVNAEQAKNEKLKALNDEMQGITKKGQKEELRDHKDNLSVETAQNKEYYEDAVAKSNHWLKMQQIGGQGDLESTKQVIEDKKIALNDWYNAQAVSIKKHISDSSKQYAELSKLDKDYSKAWDQLANDNEEVAAKIIKKSSDDAIRAMEHEIALGVKETEEKINLRLKFNEFSKEASDSLLSDAEHRLEDIIDIERKKFDYINDLVAKGVITHQEAEEEKKKATEKRIKSEKELATDKWMKENQEQQQVFNNLATCFDTAAQLYAKDSKERQALSTLSKAATVAEIALQVEKNLMIAVGAVLQQGTGDPYSAFARIAAMIAVVTGVLSIVGIAFGESVVNSGSSSSPSPAYNQNTTVLGGANDEASQSISKSWELMQDTYNMQDTKLTGIYNEMKQLNANITGIVKGIVQGGVGSLAGSGLGVSIELSYISKFYSKTNEYLKDFLEFGPKTLDKVLNSGGASFLSGINDMVGNIVGWVLNGVFGDTTTTKAQTGSGIYVGGGIVMPYASGTTTTEESGALWGLFGGGSSSTSAWKEYGSVDEILTKLFYGERGIYSTLKKTMIGMATMLGGDIALAKNKVFAAFELNLIGMSSDAIEKAVSGQISAISDAFAREVFATLIKSYQEVGEGAYETISRLAIDLLSVTDILDITGRTMTTVASDAVALSESLISLAGGLDKLQEAVSSYYDKFYTDTEKQVRLQEKLSEVFGRMNLTLPDTRAGYRALVDELDITSEWQREAWVTMIQLSEEADQYYTTLEDAYDGAISSQNNYIESLKNISLTIDKWLDNLAISDLAPVQSAAEWARQYTEAKAKASLTTATETDVSDYLNFATKYLGFQKSYGTEGSYQSIYSSVTGDVAAMGGSKNTLLSVAQQQLVALEQIALNTSTTAGNMGLTPAQNVWNAMWDKYVEGASGLSDIYLNKIEKIAAKYPFDTYGGWAPPAQLAENDAAWKEYRDAMRAAIDYAFKDYDWSTGVGGYIYQGGVYQYADGGIFDRPTLFPMANGMGVMGEAGPEAVMPLRRGKDGKLGVSMSGSGESVIHNHIYIDGKEIRYVVTKGMKTDQDLISSTRKAVNN